MPMAPGDQRLVALEVKAIYDQAELEILALIADRLSKGLGHNEWAYRKVAEVRLMQQQVQSVIDGIDSKLDQSVAAAIQGAYEFGRAAVSHDLDKAVYAGAISDISVRAGVTFDGLTPRAVTTLAQATVTGLRGTHFAIMRSANDIYRRVINQTSAQVLAGTHTVQQAVQNSLNQFADQGVSGFVDKAGRRWSLGSYAEMAVRTNTAHAAVEGAIGRMAERGHNLVVVSNHSRECPRCRPWEGKILDASNQNTDGKPNLSDATRNGLFHPNCRHTLTAYIPNFTRIPHDTEDAAGYQHEQREKSAERNIKKWLKRMQVAITPEEKAAAKTKFKLWTTEYNRLKSIAPKV